MQRTIKKFTSNGQPDPTQILFLEGRGLLICHGTDQMVIGLHWCHLKILLSISYAMECMSNLKNSILIIAKHFVDMGGVHN